MDENQSALLHAEISSKRYQQFEVLKDVSLSVKPGEVVSLVGRSGCGKSTLLRLIAGLDAQYDGQITINGQQVKLHDSKVGFVFQEPRLFPWLTVAENIGFELGKAGASHPRVNELLAEVGLQGKNDLYPKQLSGGMAQRVAIARGLFSQPSVLLLDEPFSAVDAFTKMRLQDLLRKIAEHHHTTLLFVTHDIEEAVYLSDHVCVMQANPGTIRTVVSIGLPHDRDRRDVRLARFKAQILTLLDDGCAEQMNEVVAQSDPALELNLLKFAF
jgi:sulfonate transport system ATP-binding protein